MLRERGRARHGGNSRGRYLCYCETVAAIPLIIPVAMRVAAVKSQHTGKLHVIPYFIMSWDGVFHVFNASTDFLLGCSLCCGCPRVHRLQRSDELSRESPHRKLSLSSASNGTSKTLFQSQSAGYMGFFSAVKSPLTGGNPIALRLSGCDVSVTMLVTPLMPAAFPRDGILKETAELGTKGPCAHARRVLPYLCTKITLCFRKKE